MTFPFGARTIPFGTGTFPFGIIFCPFEMLSLQYLIHCFHVRYIILPYCPVPDPLITAKTTRIKTFVDAAL